MLLSDCSSMDSSTSLTSNPVTDGPHQHFTGLFIHTIRCKHEIDRLDLFIEPLAITGFRWLILGFLQLDLRVLCLVED